MKKLRRKEEENKTTEKFTKKEKGERKRKEGQK